MYNNTFSKYLKYKNKYLQLKNLQYKQYGGELPIINNIDDINLFTDPDMEIHMNPIYGLILCNNGFILNNYCLHKSKLINTPLSKHITIICNKIPGTIQPTNKLMSKPSIDYGRFIALKYINKLNNYKLLTFIPKDLKEYGIDKNTEELLKKYKNAINCETHHNYFYFTDIHGDHIYFHLILFCLWWNSNNDQGIKEYYQGIKEVFDLLRCIPKIKTPNLVLKKQEKSNNFDKIVFKITNDEFKIYNQEKALHFCKEIIPSTYPDCGETTALNLINLICYNENILDISELSHVHPISELIEYYKVFDNFNKISDINYLPKIFCQYLNARDAWSYLIIHYANKNLHFDKKCKLQPNIEYDLMPGLAYDKSTTNFFQLIKNLLRIDRWEDIINKNITKIENNISTNGYGEIIIEHRKFNKIIIDCKSDHFYMKQDKNIVKDILLENLDQKQIDIVNELLKKDDTITKDNYLDINFNPSLLEKLLNSVHKPIELKIKLFELSLTNIYDNIDIRRKIIIDVDSNFFCIIMNKYNSYKNINEYTYNCYNFSFIYNKPYLTNLNSLIKNRDIELIDLSPLSNIKSIGHNFLTGCKNLKNIDFIKISNILSIGNFFMNNCFGLKNIDLTNLSNLKSIKDNFMLNCKLLEKIVLPTNSQLETIGNNFMNNCDKLQIIVLSTSQLVSIGNDFLKDCARLTNVDLRNLSNLKSIGNNFLKNCNKLVSMDLPVCSVLETIGDNFMRECSNLENIDFTKLTQLTTINNDFLYLCTNLKSIDLSNLSNLKSINNNFMNNCLSLKNIVLPTKSQLVSIGDNFMIKCSNLTTIDLSSQSKLITLGKSFMSPCIKLEIIYISSKQNEIFNFDISIKSKINIKSNH